MFVGYSGPELGKKYTALHQDAAGVYRRWKTEETSLQDRITSATKNVSEIEQFLEVLSRQPSIQHKQYAEVLKFDCVQSQAIIAASLYELEDFPNAIIAAKWLVDMSLKYAQTEYHAWSLYLCCLYSFDFFQEHLKSYSTKALLHDVKIGKEILKDVIYYVYKTIDYCREHRLWRTLSSAIHSLTQICFYLHLDEQPRKVLKDLLDEEQVKLHGQQQAECDKEAYAHIRSFENAVKRLQQSYGNTKENKEAAREFGKQFAQFKRCLASINTEPLHADVQSKERVEKIFGSLVAEIKQIARPAVARRSSPKSQPVMAAISPLVSLGLPKALPQKRVTTHSDPEQWMKKHASTLNPNAEPFIPFFGCDDLDQSQLALALAKHHLAEQEKSQITDTSTISYKMALLGTTLSSSDTVDESEFVPLGTGRLDTESRFFSK